MPTQAQIRIDLKSPEPATRQIAGQIRTLIVEGRLQPGDALPSVRRLATDLAVHFNTVAEAYRALADEGWLDVSHGRAARILDRPTPKPGEGAVAAFRDRIRRMLADMKASGISPARIRKEVLAAIEVLEK